MKKKYTPSKLLTEPLDEKHELPYYLDEEHFVDSTKNLTKEQRAERRQRSIILPNNNNL